MAIDLVIVVVGVFIGIQVANWNDARQAAVEERQLIGRLSDEFEAGLERAREIESETYQYTVNLDALLTKLDSGQSVSQAEARELITGVFHFRLMVTMPPSYSEMVSSGRTDLLTDPEVRGALRNFDRDVRVATSASERLYASTIPHVTLLQSYVRHERAPQAGEVDARPRIRSVDVEGLRRDSRAIAALDRVFYAQTNLQTVAHRTTRSVEAVVAALNAAER